MRSLKVVPYLFIVMVLLASSVVSAGVIVTHNVPTVKKEKGEEFEIRVEVKADETVNYTVILETRSEFQYLDGTTQTKQIPQDDSRTFIFKMKNADDLSDGKYAIKFSVQKEGEEVHAGTVNVRAGQQAPGFEAVVLVPALVIALAAVIVRKR